MAWLWARPSLEQAQGSQQHLGSLAWTQPLLCGGL